MNEKETMEYSTLISQFMAKVKKCINLIWPDVYSIGRSNVSKNEIKAARNNGCTRLPYLDNDFSMIVLQNPGQVEEAHK